MLSEEQKLQHLEKGSDCCPHCQTRQGDDCVLSDLEGDDHQVWVKRVCFNDQCGKQWVDTFTLSGVDEDGLEDMATALELRHALDKLLGVLDEFRSEGDESYEDDDRVKLARQTLAKGFVCPDCSTGTMAGPIPGTLANGERCDSCGRYASDEEARAAIAKAEKGERP